MSRITELQNINDTQKQTIGLFQKQGPHTNYIPILPNVFNNPTPHPGQLASVGQPVYAQLTTVGQTAVCAQSTSNVCSYHKL